MKYIYSILFLIFVFTSCATWKKELKTKTDYESAINNAIIDFCNTNSLSKNNNSFGVMVKDYNDSILSVGISETNQKFYKIKTVFFATLPTKYIEYNNKLFYWWDKNFDVSNVMINKLEKYHLITNVESMADVVIVIDDESKGIIYFFCKNNLLNYKKVRTKRIMRTSKLSKLNCK